MTIHTGDCIDVMAGMPADSVDAVVTDPPYGIGFMGKAWDAFDIDPVEVSWSGKGRNHTSERNPEASTPGGRSTTRTGFRETNPRCGTCGRVTRGRDTAKGFKVCHCETPVLVGTPNRDAQRFQAWCEAWGREALRVTKPGGYLLAFGGTRTHHRLVCGLEDAGWIIRDELQHIYASGFPKSHNVSNSERFCHCEREAVPEHDVRAMRDGDVSTPVAAPSGQRSLLFEEVPEPGIPATPDGAVEVALRGSEPGMEGRGDAQASERQLHRRAVRSSAAVGKADGPQGRLHDGAPTGDGRVDGAAPAQDGSGEPPRPQSGEQRPDELGTVALERDAQGGGVWPLCDRCGKPQIPTGLGTALKPAHEPIILARKPLAGSVAENVARYGTGALNIDATRIPGTEAQAYTVKRLKPGATLNKTGGNWRPDEGVDYHGETKAGRWPSNLLLSDPALFDEPNPQIIGSGSSEDGAGYSRFFTISQGKEAEGCWPWMGATDDAGYGRYGRGSYAHRIAWETVNGPIPEGMHVLHHCDNPPCVRPDHLWLGTHADNMADMAAKGRGRTADMHGEDRYNSKLTDEIVREARRLHAEGSTFAALEARLGIDQRVISKAVRGISWQHVADDPEHPIGYIIPKADRADREPIVRGQLDARRTGTGALRAEQGGEYDDFIHAAPEGIGAWLREHREAAGLSAKALCSAIGAHGAVNHGGAVSNWEQGLNRPTADQWRRLRTVLGFDDRHDEVMTALQPVPHAVREGKIVVRSNSHPTVKPTDLMRHLVRLVTPSGGTVLDPFLGSGSTAIACELEGFPWIGIEKEPEYVAIAEARLNGVQRGLGLDVGAPTSTRKGRARPDSQIPEWPREGWKESSDQVFRGYASDEEPAAMFDGHGHDIRDCPEPAA